MRTSIWLAVRCADSETAESLMSVLTPDNAEAPRGLRFTMGGAKEVVKFEIRSASSSAALSTVLALLRDVALFARVWLLSRADHAQPSGSMTN